MDKFYKKSLLQVILSLFIPIYGFCTHIVGGSLTYVYNGGNSYTVNLKLYRDCGAGNLAFPGSVLIEVRQADGSAFLPSRNFTLTAGATVSVTPVLPPCATPPNTTPCVQQRTYSLTVTLPPVPGGYHLYYGLCCRNGSVVNIVNPDDVGEYYYTYIPCYLNFWTEDFILPNGTTSDAGPTAWTILPGPTPTFSAQVNNGQFEIRGANNGSVTWVSQVIDISTYTAGVNLSMNLSQAGNMENSDTIRVSYSLNGGTKTIFPVNGTNTENFTRVFATATGLTGSTVQLFVDALYNNTSPPSEIYRIDMVSVYNNTFSQNSSPVFSQLPPLFLCRTNSYTINCSATDQDGDVLVYSLFTPYATDQLNNPTPPTYTDNKIKFTEVTWVAGYSVTSPFNSGGPNASLDAATGAMTGVANFLGQYVFGVKCSEYRNGVLLSETTRGYEVNTVVCPPFVPTTPTAGMSNSNPVCAGQTLSLRATSPDAGVTYQWTGPNGFTSALQNPTISNVTTAASGTYSVIATVSGCNSIAGTLSVTVNPIPASPIAGSNSTVCSGNTLSLTANTIAGSIYNWSGPNSFTSTLQNPTIANVTLAGAGTYTVTRTSAAGCTSTIAITDVAINQTPSAPSAGSNSPVCSGNILSLTASNISGASYTWSGPNSFSSTSQNPTITNVTTAASGTYSVTATVGGCTGSIGTTVVTINQTPAAPTAGNNSPVCSGNTLSLTASNISGASYSWSGPNSFSSTSQNPTITNVTTAASGTYSVTATVGGCTGSIGTTVVTINQTPAAPTAGNNSPICVGNTLSLTASNISGASYSWSGPNSFSSTSQNPTITNVTTAASGTYSVTATVGGCTGSIGTTVVTINQTPAAPTAGNNSPICVGNTLSLTASNISGASYSWSGPNSFSSTSQNPTITNVTTAASGTYSVTATVGGCAGLIGITSVTVNPIPTVPTAGNNSPICSGNTLSLTANTISGATYSWSGPNGFTSTVQNPTITNAATVTSGTYSVTITVDGCTGSAGVTTATVSPIPSTPIPGSNSPICTGYELSLTANNIPGATYNWSGPNGFTSSLQNPTIPNVTTAVSGSYSVSVTVDGCSGSAGTTNVVINVGPPSPTPGSNSPVCSGQTLILTATSTGVLYNWSGSNGFTSNLQNPTIANVTTAASGTYSVTATAANGCVSTPANTITVTINPTPSTASASANSPVCIGGDLSLTADSYSGATYSWNGPNSFTSSNQNPVIIGVTTANAGTYSLIITAAGCVSSLGIVTVSVNSSPLTPNPGSNSPVCTDNTLNLTTDMIPSGTYHWSGPNGFTASTQNPSITPVTMAAAGTYSVYVTVPGCVTSGTGTTSVVVNTTPAAPTIGSNSPVCEGFDLSLTANTIAGVTYKWSGPNSYTATVEDPIRIAVTTVDGGTYSATVTSVEGCTSSVSTTNVIVNPIPSAPAASSPGAFCAGSTLSLTASTISGATYNWSGQNSYTASVQNPTIPNVSTLASGTYSVTATVNGCQGPAGTFSITISYPQTTTASNSSPICVGKELSLSAGNISNATYSWAGPNGFTSILQNPVLITSTTAQGGNYSVTVTVNGCTGPATVTTATVNPLPSVPIVGSNSPICVGKDLSLTSNTIAGVTYSWSGPNSYTSAIQNSIISSVTTSDAGTYSLSVKSSTTGCVSKMATVAVIINDNPLPPTPGSNEPVCSGNTLSLTANTISGATYSWTGPNSFTATVQNPTIPNVTTAASGIYIITATVAGCSSASASTTVTINQTPVAPTAGSNSPICEGNNLSLTASGTGVSFTWSGPNSYVSAIQNPVINNISTSGSGTYSVTTTSIQGCISTDGTTVVTVKSLPAAPTAGNNGPLCIGAMLSLTANTITGATYIWNGPNSYTAVIQNPGISGVTTAESGTYSVIVTVNGCSGPAGTTDVIVSPPPTAPTVGNSSPVCSGQTLSLTASTVSGASYIWSGPNGFSSSLQNQTIPLVSMAAAGTYSVSAIIDGCAGPAGITTVTINQTPYVTASSNSPVCLSSTINLSTTNIVGATYSWSGPNGFTSLLQNPSIPNSSMADAGVYSVTSTSDKGCVGSLATTTVTITTAIVVSAGADQTVCANNATIPLSGSVTGGTTTGIWITSGTGTFVPTNTNLNASYIPSDADTTSGMINITLTSTDNKGCSAENDVIQIIITDAPTANAGTNQTVCANNSAVVLNGKVNSVSAGGKWTSSGTGIFIPNNTTLNATYQPSAADTLSRSVVLTLTTEEVGKCNASSSSMTITITPSPRVDAGMNTVACKNSSNVPLNGYSTTGSGTWVALAPATGTFVPNVNTLNATYMSSTADTIAGSVTLLLTSTSNGDCNAVSDTIKITYIEKPIVNAGTDQTVCSNNATVSLSGSSNTNAGLWSTVGTGSFVPNPNALNTTYIASSNDISGGSMKIYFSSANNGTCVMVKDSMLVSFSPSPTVNAGTNQTVCANNSLVTLNGSVTVATGVQWSTSGTGTFLPDATTLNATYQPSASDTTSGIVTITLTSTGNGNCNPVNNSITITITKAPRVNAGSDQKVCLSNPVATLSGTSTTGSGTWSTLPGGGTFADPNSLSTTYSASVMDTVAKFTKLILISINNGSCNAVSDTVILNFTPTPVVNAGVDQTVCANKDTVSLSGYSSTGSGIWASNSNGTFGNSSALTTTYVPHASEVAKGNAVIHFTSTNGCTPVSDSLVIIITPAPIVDAGANQIVCIGTDSIHLNGSVSGSSTTGVWSASGTGKFVPNNTAMNAVYVVTKADTTAGGVTFYLTSTNNGDCYAIVKSMRVSLIRPAKVNAGNDIFICSLRPVQLEGVITGGSGTGYWEAVSGAGTFSPDSSHPDAFYHPHISDTALKQITLAFISIGNGSCPTSSDTVQIKISKSPTADAGSDIITCRNNIDSIEIKGTVKVAAGGEWSTLGTGIFTPADSLLHAYYHPSVNDLSKDTIRLVLTTMDTGYCPAASDTLLIIFTPKPFVYAGADIKICTGDTIAQLLGKISGGVTTGRWSSATGGTFYPSNYSLNAKYYLSNADMVTGSIKLILTSTNNGSCTENFDTVMVTINPLPVVDAGINATVCANNARVYLNGSVTAGASKGKWASSGTGTFMPSDTSLNATYTPSNSDTAIGKVILILTSIDGCRSISDSLTVTITDAPVVNAGMDVTICEGAYLVLQGNISVASGGIWSTSGNGTFSPDNIIMNPTYHLGSNDTSIVTIYFTSTGNGQCIAMADSIQISVGRKAEAAFFVSAHCANQPVIFTDNSIVHGKDSIISWHWVIDGRDFTTQNVSHTYTTSGTDIATLIVVSSSGCSDTSRKVVKINASPVASYSVYTSCSLDSVYFTSTSSVALGTISSWNWNFGDGAISTKQNPVHRYSPGTYVVTLQVTSDSGCSAAVSDAVVTTKGMRVGFSKNQDCNFVVQFKDTSFVPTGDNIIVWDWQFGDGTSSSAKNPIHTYSISGTYSVQLQITTAGGCKGVITQILTLVPPPVADFIPKGGVYALGKPVVFTDQSVNASSWLWIYGDNTKDSIQNPTHLFNRSGKYSVMLIAINSAGCRDTAEYEFNINSSVIAIPTAFTPNRDGNNDILYVRGGSLKEMDWRIYNEWGNEIFHSVNQSTGWDGTFKGKFQPEGRYVYTLRGITYNNEEIDMHGEVTILR